MKKIVYKLHPSNGDIAVVNPVEGARLMSSITIDRVEEIFDPPISADSYRRFWPIPDAEVVWSETEEEFVRRIAEKDVPGTLDKSYTDDNGNVWRQMLKGDADKLGLSYTETPFLLVDESEIPKDRSFRDAWSHDGFTVIHDMTKVREIAHDRRRKMRSSDMEPHDFVIAAKIPGTNETAVEAERQKIRDRYAKMQTDIDAASDVAMVKEVMN